MDFRDRALGLILGSPGGMVFGEQKKGFPGAVGNLKRVDQGGPEGKLYLLNLVGRE